MRFPDTILGSAPHSKELKESLIELLRDELLDEDLEEHSVEISWFLYYLDFT